MSNFMVQNFINQHKSKVQQNPVNKPVTYSDYKHYIKGASTLAPDARLINSSLLGIREMFTYSKNIKKEYSDEVNDHKLGKFNDVAMRTSALALAGYLAINRALPVKKGMEFIGAGAFFASMALWPKIFIQAPIKALKGFNVNQKWEDSRGRRNDFFRNPTYIPWDLMTPEYINKVGDKMGVPKNMPNRQALIKDKMRKTSVQANTLWMLTAGFATPIMGALIASQLEEPLAKQVEKVQTKKINKKYANINTIVKEQAEKQTSEVFSDLLSANKNKEVGKEFVDKVFSHMETKDIELNRAIKKDIASVLDIKSIDKTADIFDNALQSDIFKNLGISKNDIETALKASKLDGNIELNSKNQSRVKDAMFKLWEEKHPNLKAKRSKIQGLNKAFGKEIKKAFELNDRNILSESAADKLTKIEETIKNYNIKRSVIDEFNLVYLGNKEDSIVARRWNRSVKKILKSLELTPKELDLARKAPETARDILDKKLTEIAADENKYKKVLTQVAQAVEDFDGFINKKNFKINGQEMNLAEYIKVHAQSLFDVTSQEMKKHKGTSAVSNYIEKNYAKKNYVDALVNTLDGSVNTIYKFVQALDFYKRLGDKSVVGSISEYLSHWSEGKMAIKQMKRVLLEGTMGDHIVKFDIKNPHVYSAVMQDLFNQEKIIDKSTGEVLNSSMQEKLKNIVKTTVDDLCNLFDKFNPSNNMESKIRVNFKQMHIEEPQAKKFMANKQARLGDALASTFKKAAEPIANTKKWNRMFAGFGIGLAAVTVIAPLFFGRIKINQGGNR